MHRPRADKRAVRRTVLGVVLLAVPVLGAAPARAAWSVPQAVSSPANEASIRTLGIDPQGRALLTWTPLRWQERHFVADGQRAATRAPAAAAFGPERRVASTLAGPVLFGVTRAVALGGPVGPWNRCGPRVDLQVRYGRSDGSFALPSTIAAFRATGGSWGPVLGANAAGQVAAAWVQSSPDCRGAIVRVARRRGGGTGAFTPAQTIRGRGRNLSPSVAVGQRGDLLAAWARRTGEGLTIIEARSRPAGGAWGPVQRLGTGTVAAPVLTGVTQNGRAYVVWQRSSISESNGLTAALYVAVQPAGRRTFRAASRLDGFRVPTSFITLRPVLAVAGNRAMVGWTGRDAARWRVWVADAETSGAFGPRQWLSEAGRDALLGDLALGPAGRAAAVGWTHTDDEQLPSDVMASVRARGASAFAPPEQVTAAVTRQLPLVALSPATLRPTVAWTENVAPPATGAAKLDVRVRVAQREP